jgi:pyrroline-5-carboxylate reductase
MDNHIQTNEEIYRKVAEAAVSSIYEALKEAGIEGGLPEDQAEQFARSTITGSCAMLEETDHSIETLIDMVASPGGTTEAGLAVLKEDGALEKEITKMFEAVRADEDNQKST